MPLANGRGLQPFTAGNHIAFNHGEYDPSSPEGQHLPAHELAHVRQQSGAAVSMMPQADANLQIDPDPRLEREAEEAAQQAMSEGPVTINRMGAEMQIQRATDDGRSMTYEGLESLTEEVASLREELETTKSDVSSLRDEMHNSFGEKAMGIAGTGLGAGAVAVGRAGVEPMLQEGLKQTAANPELAAPAIAATLMVTGVSAAGSGAKSLYERAKERFFGDGTEEEQRREEEEAKQDDSGILSW